MALKKYESSNFDLKGKEAKKLFNLFYNNINQIGKRVKHYTIRNNEVFILDSDGRKEKDKEDWIGLASLKLKSDFSINATIDGLAFFQEMKEIKTRITRFKGNVSGITICENSNATEKTDEYSSDDIAHIFKCKDNIFDNSFYKFNEKIKNLSSKKIIKYGFVVSEDDFVLMNSLDKFKIEVTSKKLIVSETNKKFNKNSLSVIFLGKKFLVKASAKATCKITFYVLEDISYVEIKTDDKNVTTRQIFRTINIV